jgi:WD40 repeat protein
MHLLFHQPPVGIAHRWHANRFRLSRIGTKQWGCHEEAMIMKTLQQSKANWREKKPDTAILSITLQVWDTETGRCLRILNDPSHILSSATVMSAHGNAGSGSDEENIPVWDLDSGQCLGTHA